MTDRKVVFAGLLGAVLVAGIAIGVIGDRLLTRPAMTLRLHTDMSSILDELELSRDQRTRADSIVARRTPGSETMMLDMADKLRAMSDSIDTELRAILTPEQAAQLDSLRAKRMMLKRKTVTPTGTRIDTLTMPRKP